MLYSAFLSFASARAKAKSCTIRGVYHPQCNRMQQMNRGLIELCVAIASASATANNRTSKCCNEMALHCSALQGMALPNSQVSCKQLVTRRQECTNASHPQPTRRHPEQTRWYSKPCCKMTPTQTCSWIVGTRQPLLHCSEVSH